MPLAWSGDGKTLTLTHGGTVVLIDPKLGRVVATYLATGPECPVAITADGHTRGSTDSLRYVVRTNHGQETLTAEEFAKRFPWKNDQNRIRLVND